MRAELIRNALRERHAEERVQLVHLAVGLDAQIRLRDALPVAEARLARVAAPGVDPVEPNRLVALAHAGTGSARSARPSTDRAITSRWISLVPS